MSEEQAPHDSGIQHKFVVRVGLLHIEAGKFGVQTFDAYLCAIKYDPYNKGGDRPSFYEEDPEEAFIFDNHVSAEIAAVMVGGMAWTLEAAKAKYAAKEKSE